VRRVVGQVEAALERQAGVGRVVEAGLTRAPQALDLACAGTVGPRHSEDRPIALSNPIFVDVDGGGFEANGDALGAPVTGRRP
jgi:hypothetical protein